MGLPFQRYRFWNSVPALLALVSLGVCATGCNKTKPAANVQAVPVKNVNSKGLAKLSPTEIEKKIQAVQANGSIPESAKPSIIQSIRAQGEP